MFHLLNSSPLVPSLECIQLGNLSSFLSIPRLRTLIPRHPKFSTLSLCATTSEPYTRRLSLSQTLQSETLGILEWGSVCKQLASFASTSMGHSTALKAGIPLGGSRRESQKLLDQTTASVAAMEMMGSRPPDFSGIEDISGIVDTAASGELLTVNELCAVRRTLRAARGLFDKLDELASSEACSERYCLC